MTSLSPDPRVRWGPQASVTQDPGATVPEVTLASFTTHHKWCPLSHSLPQCPPRNPDDFSVQVGETMDLFSPELPLSGTSPPPTTATSVFSLHGSSPLILQTHVGTRLLETGVKVSLGWEWIAESVQISV